MDVFFYGLFMDPNVLLENGIEPSNLRTGYLKDFALRIGNRASLIPSPGDTCFGIVMACDKYALQKLYGEASVADYLPEEVIVHIADDHSVHAICYNLPQELIAGTNSSYAESLYQLAKKYDFPTEYLLQIKAFVQG